MQFTRRFEQAAALEGFAAELSLFARPGMVLLLKGDLGTGKTQKKAATKAAKKA